MFLYLFALAYLLPPKITLGVSLVYLTIGSIFLLIEYKKSQLRKKKESIISYDERFQKFLTEEEKEELDLMFTTGKHK
jgi:hypothetical protein